VATLHVYCDGSGEERVGRPGGWAFVVVRDEAEVLHGEGAVASTTSLIMELEAALAGLRAVLAKRWHERHEVVLISDSSIALDIAAGRFTPKPPQYAELSAALRKAATRAKASTKWVRAHGGHRWNEEVDARARAARLGLRIVERRR